MTAHGDVRSLFSTAFVMPGADCGPPGSSCSVSSVDVVSDLRYPKQTTAPPQPLRQAPVTHSCFTRPSLPAHHGSVLSLRSSCHSLFISVLHLFVSLLFVPRSDLSLCPFPVPLFSLLLNSVSPSFSFSPHLIPSVYHWEENLWPVYKTLDFIYTQVSHNQVLSFPCKTCVEGIKTHFLSDGLSTVCLLESDGSTF